MPQTQRSSCYIRVSEFGPDTQEGQTSPYIMIEIEKPGLPIIGEGFITLEFREQISMKEAEKIAELLRDKIDTVTVTTF